MKFLRSRFFNLARFKTLKSRWNEKKSFTSVSTGSYQFTPPPMHAEISSTDAINVAISTIGGLFDNITYVVYIYNLVFPWILTYLHPPIQEQTQ